MTESSEDYELFHYGVKGMKWGVVRDEQLLNKIAGRPAKISGGTREERKAFNKEGKERYKEYKKNTSKKERKEDRRAAMEERGRYLIDHAVKNPDKVLITRDVYGTPTVTQGKTFMENLSRTGMLDVKYTEVTNMTLKQMVGR